MGGIIHVLGVGAVRGAGSCSGCQLSWDRLPRPSPEAPLLAAVRALRVICACAEGYYRAQEPAPEAKPQPSMAAM